MDRFLFDSKWPKTNFLRYWFEQGKQMKIDQSDLDLSSSQTQNHQKTIRPKQKSVPLIFEQNDQKGGKWVRPRYADWIEMSMTAATAQIDHFSFAEMLPTAATALPAFRKCFLLQPQHSQLCGNASHCSHSTLGFSEMLPTAATALSVLQKCLPLQPRHFQLNVQILKYQSFAQIIFLH